MLAPVTGADKLQRYGVFLLLKLFEEFDDIPQAGSLAILRDFGSRFGQGGVRGLERSG